LALWNEYALGLRELLGEAQRCRVELSDSDFRALQAMAPATRPAPPRAPHRRARVRIGHRPPQRIAEQVRVLAERLGKGEVLVETNDTVRFRRDRWASFWSSFTPSIRNAVDHGVESKHERVQAVSERRARCFAHREKNDSVIIELSDDGAASRGTSSPRRQTRGAASRNTSRP